MQRSQCGEAVSNRAKGTAALNCHVNCTVLSCIPFHLHFVALCLAVKEQEVELKYYVYKHDDNTSRKRPLEAFSISALLLLCVACESNSFNFFPPSFNIKTFSGSIYGSISFGRLEFSKSDPRTCVNMTDFKLL